MSQFMKPDSSMPQFLRSNYQYRGSDPWRLAWAVCKALPEGGEISFSKFITDMFKPYDNVYNYGYIFRTGAGVKMGDMPDDLVCANVEKVIIMVNEDYDENGESEIRRVTARAIKAGCGKLPEMVYYFSGKKQVMPEASYVVDINCIFLGMGELDKLQEQKERQDKKHVYINDQEEFERVFNSAAPHKTVRRTPYADIKVLSPKEIYALLSEKVFGQEDAKKSISVVLSQHLKRLEQAKNGKQLQKVNALLVGPTGCGKTMIAKTIADIANVPFIKVDATNFVQRGYRGGMHAWQMINLLIGSAKGNTELAKSGIVFIDETDKIAWSGKDDDGLIATQAVQTDLMSMIDGGDVYYEPDDEDYAKRKFSCKNVLFIFGGAFSGMSHIDLTSEDLTRFGFLPEFSNRLGNIIVMEHLSEEVIKMLVRKAVDEYSSYTPLTDSEKNAYTELIHLAIVSDRAHLSMGGRAVAPVVRRFFEERMFEAK